MYNGHTCLSVCLSVRGRTHALLHRPGLALAEVITYTEDRRVSGATPAVFKLN